MLCCWRWASRWPRPNVTGPTRAPGCMRKSKRTNPSSRTIEDTAGEDMKSLGFFAFRESEPAKERTPHPCPHPFGRGEGRSSAVLPRNRAHGLTEFLDFEPRYRGSDSPHVVSHKNFGS